MEKIWNLWEYFVRKYQPLVVKSLLFIAFVFLVLISVNVIRLNSDWLLSIILFAMFTFAAQLDGIYQRVLTPKLRIYEHHNAKYNEDMMASLTQSKVTKAQLLEFSTYSIHTNLLESLVGKRYKIQLLLSHPESAPNIYQRETVEKYLRELMLLREQYSRKQDFQIKCYKERASFRGRKIGNSLISLSWFTYGTQRIEKTNLPESEKARRRPQDLEGHTNMIINAELSTPEGKIFEEMFDRVFSDLWSSAIPIDSVMKSLSPEK